MERGRVGERPHSPCLFRWIRTARMIMATTSREVVSERISTLRSGALPVKSAQSKGFLQYLIRPPSLFWFSFCFTGCRMKSNFSAKTTFIPGCCMHSSWQNWIDLLLVPAILIGIVVGFSTFAAVMVSRIWETDQDVTGKAIANDRAKEHPIRKAA